MSAKELQKVFDEVDKDGAGSISKEEVEIVIKKLNPNFSDAELSKVVKGLEPKMVDGKLKNTDFIDYFCAPDNASNASNAPLLRKELSRTMSKAEDEAIQAAFKTFDTDGNQTISLKELRAICESLGKKVSDEQVAEAYKQLDKNGDGKATFEEFKLWWTCTPGLGGHNHMILRFLKTKLAAKDGLHRVMNRVTRKKLENTGEFHLKAKSEFTDAENLDVQSTIRCTMTKKEADDVSSKMSITFGMKDDASAAKVVAAHGEFFKVLAALSEVESSDYAKHVVWSQEANKVIITIVDASGGMIESDEDMQGFFDFVQNAVSKLEASVGLGTSFANVLAHPNRALLTNFKGFSVEADVNMRLDHWVKTLDPYFLPPFADQIVKIFGGVSIDNKLKFNEQEVRNFLLAHGGDLGKVMTSGIEHARDLIYSTCVEDGTIVNGSWDLENAENKTSVAFFKVFKELAASGTCIESIKLEPKNGSSILEFTFSFENFNPFPLLKYLIGDLPNDPARTKTSKPMSAEAATAMEETFKTFDKDGSGAIDLKELKQVTEAMGGTLDDSGAEDAMRSLDKNGDGTCNFEEFKLWWCSEPGMGGYDKGSLAFLKAKMGAQDMIGKFANLVSVRSGHKNTASSEALNITAQYEVSPGMEECKSKMHLEFYVSHEDKKADGLLTANVNFNAKSVDAASKIAEKIQEAISLQLAGMLEMMQIPSPQCKAEGSTVTITIQLPSGIMEEMNLNEALEAIVPFLKLYSNDTRFKLKFANDIDDILAATDKTLPELFEGAKFETSCSVPAAGRTFLLETMKANEHPNPWDPDEVQPSHLWSMYNGGHLVALFGYNKDALSTFMSNGAPEEVRHMLTVAGSREVLTSQTAMYSAALADPEMKPYVTIAQEVLNCIDTLDSISIENIEKPSLTNGETPTTYAIHCDFGNFKPFGLIKYYLDPILAQAEGPPI